MNHGEDYLEERLPTKILKHLTKQDSKFFAKNPKKNLASKTPKRPSDEQISLEDCILIQSLFRMHLGIQRYKIKQKLYQQRAQVANEILTTEIDYINNLKTLSTDFLKPLLAKKNQPTLGDTLYRELALSLSGIEVILAFHSTTIDEIKLRVNNWNNSSRLGSIFEQMGLFLKSYSQYVNHYQQVVQFLAKRKHDKQFQSILESLKNQPTGKGVQDYMIMPVQRIPRYVMLLGV